MKRKVDNNVVVDLMACVTGTTTSSEALALFITIDKALKDNCSVKLSLLNATPMSSSFLNASFGELYDNYGFNTIKQRISLINYKPSQALQIKDYLETISKLAK